MSFAMTHLAIAKEINDKIHIANDLPQFFLGILAPDSVHCRENYHGDMKKNSHFVINKKPWGSTTSTQECDDWFDYFSPNIKPRENHQHSDFYMGCLIHILTDISNTRKIYVPFVEWCDRENKTRDEMRSLFYSDCRQIDMALFNTLPWKDEVWALMLEAQGETIGSIINATEAEKYRDVSFERFIRGEYEPDKPQNLITVDDNFRFIEDTVDEIIGLLKVDHSVATV